MKKAKRLSRVRKYTRLERLALFLTSFVWTMACAGGLGLGFFYQDPQFQAWLFPPASSQPAPTPAPVVSLLASPLPTLAAHTRPTATPTPTLPPTPTATRVVPLPEALPEMPDAPAPAEEPVFILGTPTPAYPQAEAAAVTIGQPAEQPTVAPMPAQVLPPPPTLSPRQQAAAPTRLVIQAVGIDSTVEPVGWHVIERNGQLTSVWQVAEYAVGWHQTSALPGQPGNSVLVAHSNTQGEVFRHLDKIELGDQIQVMVRGQTFSYVVDFTTIVKEAGESPAVRRQNTRWIGRTSDERLTLVTCWPYPHSTHRLIVVARPLEG